MCCCSIDATSAQRLKTLACFERSKPRCFRVPGARLSGIALHAYRSQACEHRRVVRPRQHKGGFGVAGFRDMGENKTGAGDIAQGDQVTAALEE